MNSFERVVAVLTHQQPDRVPVFLFLTVHGAKELRLSLKEYFSRAGHVVEAQKRMLRKYGHDCVYPLFYAAREAQAFGCEVIFYEDGPPNAGGPVITRSEDIDGLEVPDPSESVLSEPLRAIELLADELKGEVPIISGVVAPFSLPVMLMGFENWMDLFLFGDKDARDKLLKKTQRFCVSWANAQLKAGVDALGYFDPLATSDMITRDEFLKYDFKLTKDTIKKIKGPVAYAGAGGRFWHIIDLIPDTGAAGVVISSKDALGDVKAVIGGRITVMGNLNNVEMAGWTIEDAKSEVERCLRQGKPHGGYILADQHGEIPYYVKDDVLHAIVETVEKHGRYGRH
jgi:uroporphyrinogen decarboxylase